MLQLIQKEDQIQSSKVFHLSQSSLPRGTPAPTHHRPLVLLMVLTLLTQQFGMFDAFAGSVVDTIVKTPVIRDYIHIRTNPMIDDSWLGTTIKDGFIESAHVNDGSWILPSKKTTQPSLKRQVQQVTSQSINHNASSGPLQVIGSSWILTPKSAKTQNKSKISSNVLELNSAPTIPNTNILLNNTPPTPANYVTANGTSYYDIPGNTGPQNTNTTGNQIVSGNSIINGSTTTNGFNNNGAFSQSGNITITGDIVQTGSMNVSGTGIFGSINTHTVTADNLTLSGGIGVPTSLLGRDGSGQVNGVILGYGLTLSGGKLDLNLSGGSTIVSSGAISGGSFVTNGITLSGGAINASGSISANTFSGNNIISNTGSFQNITSNTGTIANLISNTGSVTHLLSDLIEAVSGYFTDLIADTFRATQATITSLIAGNLTSTGSANFNNASFSGNVSFDSLPELPLTQGSLLVGDTGDTASELIAGGTGQILVILNGTPVWTDATTVAPVISTFGRTGSVVAQSGDYNTSQITESGSLYFTNARARASISATGVVTYDVNNGVIGWNGTTDNVSEGVNNLYYTESRFSGSLDAQKNTANGVAGLDANAKISLMNLPGITMNTVWSANNKTDCTTKSSATRGDICIATADSKSYILSTTNPSNISDWQELLNPAAPVSQVNGQVGNINFIGTNGVSISGTTVSLTNVGTAGVYGSTTKIPVITTDAQGRVTNITETTIPTATASGLGLLSPTDYVRFDAKQDLIGTGTISQYYRGDKTWATLDTSIVPENGNLYFTVTRVQDAMSGAIAGIQNQITTLSGSINTLVNTVQTLSGVVSLNYTNLSGSISTLSGTLANTNTQLTSLSGTLANTNATLSALSTTITNNLTDIATLSGTLANISLTVTTLSGNLATLSNTVTNNYNTLSGSLAHTNSQLSTLSGSVSSISDTLSTLASQVITLQNQAITLGAANGLSLSGNTLSLALASSTTTGALSATDWNRFNNKINLTSLSATGGISYNSGTGLFSDLFTFNNGLTRIHNTIGIGTLTGGMITGLSSGGLTFGASNGSLTQSPNLFWDNTNGSLGIGTASPGRLLDVFNTGGSTIRIRGGTSGTPARRAILELVSDDVARAQGILTVENSVETWFYGKGYNTNNFTIGYSGSQSEYSANSKLSITPTGNVGIGTATPGAKLDVNGTIQVSGNHAGGNRVTFVDTSGSGGHQWELYPTNGYFALYDRTSSLQPLTVLNNGNIGIGTNAPGAGLEVASDNSTKSNFFVTDTRSFAESVGGQFYFRGKYNTAGGYALFGRLSGNKESATDGETKGYLSFQTNNGGGESNLSEKMRILGNGNVGIGTAAPGAKLDVNGDALINGLTIGRGSGNLALNMAIGNGALYSNTTGNYNTANGVSSLYSNTTGASNIGVGYQSLYSNTTGSSNVALGYRALNFNSTGSLNTAVGYSSLYSNTTGVNNTANGAYALHINTIGDNNTANGYNSLHSNTIGDSNTAIGVQSLYLNTTGNYNTAIGHRALYLNSTGSNNTANGYYSLYSNTTGTNNTANGMYSLNANTIGTSNTANGFAALYSNTTGLDNTANGSQSLYYNTTGNSNVANGYRSLYLNATGASNVGIGHQAGSNLVSGNNNIAIGAGTNFVSTTGSNQLNIGNWIYGSGGNMSIGTTTPNAKFEINSGIAGSGGLRFTQLNSASASQANNGKTLSVNGSGDVILVDNPLGGNVIAQQLNATDNTVLNFDGYNFRYNSTTTNFELGLASGTGNISYIGDVEYPGGSFGVSNASMNLSTTYQTIGDPGIIAGERIIVTFTNNVNGNTYRVTMHKVSASKTTMYAEKVGMSSSTILSANNGININNSTLQLGGGLITNTTITNSGSALTISGGVSSTTFAANGNVGIGTSSPTALLSVNGATNNTTGAWGVFSDARSKDNIFDYTRGLTDLIRLRPVTFSYKSGFGMGTGTHVGFIAQELQSVIPEMVTNLGTINGISDFLENNQEGMNQLLVKSIQELNHAKADTGALESLSGSLASQSLVLSQIQSLVNSLQSNSGASSTNPDTIINNYYTSTGTSPNITTDPAYTNIVDSITNLSISLSGQSMVLAQLQAHMDGLSMSAGSSISGSTISSDNRIEWTHSGMLIDQIQSDTSSPRNVLTHITNLLSHAIDIVRDFVALEITALRGYFDQIFAKHVTTDTLTSIGADIGTIHTDKICIKKSNGSEICLTGDQFEAILNSIPVIPPSTPSAPIIPPTTSGEGTGDTNTGTTLESNPTTTSTIDTGTTTTSPSTNVESIVPTNDIPTNPEPTDTSTVTP